MIVLAIIIVVIIIIGVAGAMGSNPNDVTFNFNQHRPEDDE